MNQDKYKHGIALRPFLAIVSDFAYVRFLAAFPSSSQSWICRAIEKGYELPQRGRSRMWPQALRRGT